MRKQPVHVEDTPFRVCCTAIDARTEIAPPPAPPRAKYNNITVDPQCVFLHALLNMAIGAHMGILLLAMCVFVVAYG